jgi:phosphoglycolate phosphatase-like HAD superfamily hydrolase
MESIDTILFDWDGTLVDSASVAFEATRKSLYDLGITLRYDRYEQIYSPDWYQMYEALRLPKEKWQAADDGWIRHYGQTVSGLVPEGRRTLNELWRRGYCLGVVTSGNKSRVWREIKIHELDPIFQVVVCGEDVVNRKPHPEGLGLAMERISKKPDVCCYVGDSLADIEMGKRANIRTIGIRSRFPGSKELLNVGPDLFFESITFLLGHFESPARI